MLTFPITLARPEYLLLLPPAVVLIWLIQKHSRARLSSAALFQVTVLRLIVSVLLSFAAAEPRWSGYSNNLTTVFVVDVSDSIPLDERQAALRFIGKALSTIGSSDRAGLVVFGSEPFVEAAPTKSLDLSTFSTAVPGDSTNIQEALSAAAGIMPADGAKRIVLFTDGLQNSGDARSDIPVLKREGVQVDTAPSMLDSRGHPEALVNRVSAPNHVSIDAPFVVRLVLSTSCAQRAELTLQRDGRVIETKRLDLQPGKSGYLFQDKVSVPGWHRYTADLIPTADTLPQNNSASAAVLASGIDRVLYVRDSEELRSGALPAALRAQGVDVQVTTPSSMPADVGGLAQYGSIVLSDVAAGDLSPAQMVSLLKANHDFGIGLGMIGGLNSFCAGGYAGTPVEAALPVSMTPRQQVQTPAADVVIVLDASGSMSAEENGVEKVEIAARAALNLLSALHSGDRVSVLAVTETAEVVMPLVSPADASKYIPAIESVSAGGGGIDCRNGLQAAYMILDGSTAPIKHVIICPDTTDSEQQDGCDTLAAEMYKESKITTSVCGIGQWSDSDVPFQQSLAESGHGRLYVASQAANLPQFFQRDVSSLQTKLYLEGSFSVVSGSVSTDLGTVGHLPHLLGYDVTKIKPGAGQALQIGPERDPLVSYWQDGAGRSFTFTSDDQMHWAKPWLTSWRNYGAYFARIVRWSLKARENGTFQTTVTGWNGTGRIVVNNYNDSGFITNGSFSATVSNPDGTDLLIPLVQSSPGEYRADFPMKVQGDYLIEVKGKQGTQTASLTSTYSPEYADLEPDTVLLDDLSSNTSGRVLSSPAEAFRRSSIWNPSTTSLVKPLLLLAAIMFIVDIAWRRLLWRLSSGKTVTSADRVSEKKVQEPAHQKSRFKAREPRAEPRKLPALRNGDDEQMSGPTAKRADDDENPFPFVASLPRRRPKESGPPASKDRS